MTGIPLCCGGTFSYMGVVSVRPCTLIDAAQPVDTTRVALGEINCLHRSPIFSPFSSRPHLIIRPLIHFFHHLQYGSVRLIGTDENVFFPHFFKCLSRSPRPYSFFRHILCRPYNVHQPIPKRIKGHVGRCLWKLIQLLELQNNARLLRPQFTSHVASFSPITLFMRLTFVLLFLLTFFFAVKIGITEALTCWLAEYWSLAIDFYGRKIFKPKEKVRKSRGVVFRVRLFRNFRVCKA